jgi:hypothetical protein
MSTRKAVSLDCGSADQMTTQRYNIRRPDGAGRGPPQNDPTSDPSMITTASATMAPIIATMKISLYASRCVEPQAERSVTTAPL